MIYFITDGEYVKIGFTDQNDITNRLNALQIGNARKLRLLGCIEGGRETESVLHNVFQGFRVRGEWFLMSLPDNSAETEPDCVDPSQLGGTKLTICNLIKESPGMSNTAIADELGVSRQYVGQVKKELNGALRN
jgi:hypothetical protein